MSAGNAFPTREDVQVYLFREAALLDDWKIEEWFKLYTEDARYLVPTTNSAKDASPDDTLFYIADDHTRLRERVVRLTKKMAHAEYPKSKTRHLVSNVLIEGCNGDEVDVSAAFIVYRFKDGGSDMFVGTYRYTLLAEHGTLKIRQKKSLLDMDGLRPQGRISILL